MSYRIGINGFGRIGRAFARCGCERELSCTSLDIVAVNNV